MTSEQRRPRRLTNFTSLIPTARNNSATSPTASTAVNASSDLKATAASANSPASFGAYAPFDVTSTATLHNNGPAGPTNADTSFALTLPVDCSTGSTNPYVAQNTSLPVSSAIVVPTPTPATWSVTCTNPGLHTFQVCATVTVDQLHVTDPNGANNSQCDTTTTNIVPAHITVCKDVIPNEPTLWDFSATGPTPANVNDLADGACALMHPNMIPGDYTVSETFALGYAQSVDCGGNDFANDNEIEITLDPGEQVTCLFVNSYTPGPPAVGGIAGLIGGGGDDAPRSPAHDETSSGVPMGMIALAVMAAVVIAGAGVTRFALSRANR